MDIKNRLYLGVKLIVFLLIIWLVVGEVNGLLKPKYYYNETWSTTNTYLDFYKLEKNSVDVLLFGSSHAVSTLNPQVLYDNYGITSYNMGCEQQSPLITYYWLYEALKYQTPKVVIIDTYTFHKYTDAYIYNGMNCDEGAVRKAMDSMRLSPLKFEAAKNIERYDDSQSALSFLLLNLRYHTRWTGLGENDYTEASMIDHGGVKGFSVLGGNIPDLQYIPFKDADSQDVEPEEMVDIAKEYIGKTIELCKNEGIQLIFVNIPCGESAARYKSTKQYAESFGIPFYDFNEEVLYNEISYNASENLLSHPNYLGAEKISMYIGDLLTTQYGIESRVDDSYNDSRSVYEHKIKNIKIEESTDIYQYLDLINDDNYSIFIFAPKNYSSFLNDGIMEKLFALGFDTDLRGIEDGIHYYAVKDGTSIFEQHTKEDIIEKNSIRNGMVVYSININTQVMLENYHTYSLNINGIECGNAKAGINIIVYDNDFKCIIDRVNINTSVEENTFSHY